MMRRSLICLLIGLSVVTVDAQRARARRIRPRPPSAASALYFATTYNCSSDWTEGAGPSPFSSGCTAEAGNASWMLNHLDLAGACNGKHDEIVAAANRAAGGGGKGMRHWRCDGFDINGGGMKIDWRTGGVDLTEIYVRFWMRYELGFAWSSGTPGFTKDLYMSGCCGGDEHIFGFHTGEMSIEQESPARNYLTTGSSWATVMGGSTGDGAWHCYEWHDIVGNGSNGTVEIRVDGVQTATYTNATTQSNSVWRQIVVGSNQNQPSNGGNAVATDYDDIAISRTAWVGCS